MIVVAPPADAAEGPAVAAEARRAGAEVVVPPTRPAEMRDSIELGLEALARHGAPRRRAPDARRLSRDHRGARRPARWNTPPDARTHRRSRATTAAAVIRSSCRGTSRPRSRRFPPAWASMRSPAATRIAWSSCPYRARIWSPTSTPRTTWTAGIRADLRGSHGRGSRTPGQSRPTRSREKCTSRFVSSPWPRSGPGAPRSRSSWLPASTVADLRAALGERCPRSALAANVHDRRG